MSEGRNAEASRADAGGPGPEGSVPVTMGSPEFSVTETGAFRFISAWFPGEHVLHPHVHDRANFTTILSGGFDLEFTSPALSSRRRPCPPSTVFVEPVGEKHANYIYDAGTEALVIQPHPDRDDLFGPVEDLLDGTHHFRHGGIASLAGRIARELRSPDSLTPLATEAYALEMLALAARLESSRRRSSGPPAWLERARDFVHAHYREGLTIADVAATVDVHPAHLARVFRRVHRMPLGEYIRRLRIEWVADRLIRTRDPISSIAFEAGFADQSHLTRRFKRATGLTPGAYREAHRPE